MSNISKMKSSQLREVLPVVEECCRKLDIDFYIIGALAREIWFSGGGLLTGGTRDIDLALFVSDENQFDQLKGLLIEDQGFHKAKENAFVLFAPNGTQIDILPFGSLEVEDGVVVPSKGLTKIKVNGFKEVYLKSVTEVRVLEERTYKIATLSGIFLLKLVAFDDRPEQRAKDAGDCMTIIEHFFDLQSDLIWENHNDLFDSDRSLQQIGSRVIGREMRRPLLENTQLMGRVIAILENHIRLREQSQFVQLMAEMSEDNYYDEGESEGDFELTIEDCVSYLAEILSGIREVSK